MTAPLFVDPLLAGLLEANTLALVPMEIERNGRKFYVLVLAVTNGPSTPRADAGDSCHVEAAADFIKG